MNGADAPLVMTGVHLQPYNEVVRPGQVWKISKYFLRRWTPYLSPSSVWLVIGARQESYFNGNRPWFTAYDANLAAAAGVHVRSFRRSAKKEIAEGKEPLATFISKVGDPAYVKGQPVPKQEETRYEVRLDDPLTPADANHLAFWLRRHAPAQVTPQTVAALLEAARQERSQSLRAPEIDPSSQTETANAPLLTVADVVNYVFPAVATAPVWKEATDRLHTHIVEPHLCHLETHYLRHKWLAELGPGPLLLFVYLRSLCYHNPQTGETRDEAVILSGELEQLFQKSSVTLRAWFSRLDELLGDNHIHGPFIETLSTQKLPTQQVETTYRLNLLTPLHPDDVSQYQLLLTRPDVSAVDATNGVAQEMSATQAEGEESFVSHVTEGEQSFVSHANRGHETSGSHVARGGARNVSHAAGGEQTFVRGSSKKWQPYKYYKYLLTALDAEQKALFLENTQQQQQAWKIDSGKALQSFAAAAFGSLKGLLDHFGIQGKTRWRIREAGLSLEAVTAWYLYAQQQDGLDYPERYMMKQAAMGEAPPVPFLQLAEMSWEQWRTFTAAHELSPWLDTRRLAPLFQEPLFAAWDRLYGALPASQLPLGVGGGLQQLAHELESINLVMSANGRGDSNVAAQPSNADAMNWQATLDELSLQMTRATFNAWLRDATFLRRDGDTFVIGVRNQAAKEWLENRMQGVVERTLGTVVGKEMAVQFVAGK